MQGYENFLEAIHNPDHDEHEEYLTWVGAFLTQERPQIERRRTIQELRQRAEQLEKAEKRRQAEAARQKHIDEMKALAAGEAQAWRKAASVAHATSASLTPGRQASIAACMARSAWAAACDRASISSADLRMRSGANKVSTGMVCSGIAFKRFEDFFEAYRRQLNYFIDIKVRGNNVIERLYATYMPAPFLSCLLTTASPGARIITTVVQGITRAISRGLALARWPMP